MKILLITIAISGILAFVWFVLVRLGVKIFGGRPCPYRLAWLLDNPIRRRYMQYMLERVAIQPGEYVLELGPGTGVFSLEAAKRASPGGKLIAVDIQPQMIAAVEKKAGLAGIKNIETHVAGAYQLPLQNASIDRAFLVTVLPEIPDKQRALQELGRVIKSGGCLSLTEEFIDPDYQFIRTTIKQVEKAGFRLKQRFGNWIIYTLNFQKL